MGKSSSAFSALDFPFLLLFFPVSRRGNPWEFPEPKQFGFSLNLHEILLSLH